MRKICSSANTSCSCAFSDTALARSVPNGFSMMMRQRSTRSGLGQQPHRRQGGARAARSDSARGGSRRRAPARPRSTAALSAAGAGRQRHVVEGRGEGGPVGLARPCGWRTDRAPRAASLRKPSASMSSSDTPMMRQPGMKPGAAEVEQARQQLAPRQIAGRADEHDDLRDSAGRPARSSWPSCALGPVCSGRPTPGSGRGHFWCVGDGAQRNSSGDTETPAGAGGAGQGRDRRARAHREAVAAGEGGGAADLRQGRAAAVAVHAGAVRSRSVLPVLGGQPPEYYPPVDENAAQEQGCGRPPYLRGDVGEAGVRFTVHLAADGRKLWYASRRHFRSNANKCARLLYYWPIFAVALAIFLLSIKVAVCNAS